MTETPKFPGKVRFGVYEADLATGELRKRGRKIRLTGRPFQILALLLEHPGALVPREEIRAKLWPADTFVDFEHGMNSAVRKMRDALSDSAKKPRYVETLARRGYRFIAAAELVAAESLAPAIPSAAEQVLHAWVGQVATVADRGGGNYVLLPVDEETLQEKLNCEAASDDLGISLLAAAEKLLLIPCGTTVKILEAHEQERGCRVRILKGHFIGRVAFAPREFLGGLA
jgi:DNA-binding winged helix-turn-helix (wHTH) protein